MSSFDGQPQMCRADALNALPRATVLKLRAIPERTIRRERPTWTGRIQDTVTVSTLDDKRSDVKRRPERRL